MNLNSPPSPFPAQDDHHYTDPIWGYHSSSMASCHDFFKDYDRCDMEHLEDQSGGNHSCSEGRSSGLVIKDTVESDLELNLWKKEDQGHGPTVAEHTNNKYMSLKMKNPDRLTLKLTTKLEDQKPHLTTHPETNQPSCNNSPIRVCSDCNTTKTPLWRSGPKGPKSLCNACGIRQRKARRAMAVAAAANGNSCVAAIGANKHPIKVHRDKIERNLARQPHSSQIKKRCKATTTPHVTGRGRSPPNNGPQKRRFEDLLINLSKKLAIHRVFPQDEKDAALLLMALSYGLVHG